MNPLSDIYSGASNGFREVWSNKVRSLLSMSGIILGVAALVAMVGIVQGMLDSMRASFERSGGVLKLEVHPNEAPESQQHIAGISPGMSWRDIGAIKKAIPLADFVSPVVDMRWERFIANGEREGGLLHGVTPDYANIKRNELLYGRFISDYDIKMKSPVIVVGPHLAKELFAGQSNVIGEQVRVRGQVYTIIGQIKSVGRFDPGMSNKFNYESRFNYIPATTAMSRYKGNEEINYIEILALNTETIPDLIEQIENTLIQTHRGILDFEIRTQEEQMAELVKLENSFTYSLGGIAGISLLVGGIGIMNVMLASVSERIREIGVRKAIGARSYDIFMQFLAEAVVISVVGGFLGLLLSIGLLSLARDIIPEGRNISLLPMSAMLYGFIFSSLVGLASGVYPALRASRLDPIEALRYE